MKITDRPYAATRREIALDVPFERFTKALESLLGTMDLGALRAQETTSPQHVRERLASFAGPSGFALFQKIDHGNVLALLGERKTRALTYVFGNALIASEMTKHALFVGLYVPPRLLVHEPEPGRTVVTYDLTAATFAQFQSPAVDAVARSLDAKIGKLVSDAALSAGRDTPSREPTGAPRGRPRRRPSRSR